MLTPKFALIIDADLPGGAYPLLTAAGASAPVPQWTAGADDHLQLVRIIE